MITYEITVTSKNKQTLNFLFLFLNKIKQPKVSLLKTFSKQKTLVKKITLLKSPHVNKKAQKQLESKIFSKKIYIFSYNETKLLILLKKLKLKIFPEIKIKVKIFYNKIFNNNIIILNNFTINFIKNKKLIKQTLKSKNIKTIKIKPVNKIKNYLKILDYYGELNLL